MEPSEVERATRAVLGPQPDGTVLRDAVYVKPGCVYVWGLGNTKTCPLGVPPDSQGHVCFPTRVPKLQNIVHVDVCQGGCGAVTKNGRLFTWGTNRRGRLGHTTEGATVPAPREVAALHGQKVRSVHFGEGHAACILADGRVRMWGDGSGGCLGDGDVSVHAVCTPAPVVLPDGAELCAEQLALGSGSTLALLADGRVLAFGSNEFGQLGLAGVRGAAAPVPVPVPPCRFVSLGSRYALAVALDGRVYAWGFGLFGNLGLGQRVRCAAAPRPVTFPPGFVARAVAATRGQPVVKEWPRGELDGKEGPTSFACGARGECFGFGSAHKGKLGNFTKKTFLPRGADALAPYRIGAKAADAPGDTGHLAGAHIVQVLAAHIHSGALDSDGRLFTWGCGSDGRMGQAGFFYRGRKRTLKFYQSVPTHIEAFAESGVKVHFAATGKRQMIAIASPPPK